MPHDLTPLVTETVGPAVPEGLFAPRQRRSLVGLGTDWPETGCLGLPIPRSRWSDATAFGARRHSTPQGLKRLYVAKAAAVAPFLQPHVPLIARRDFVPLRAEIHPRGLWAASLINLFDDRSHKGLRAQAYAAAGYICEICGSGEGAMEAWEHWSYEGPAPDAERGVMRLQRLVCVCRPCHEMCRLDRAQKVGRTEAAHRRMQVLNGWSPEEFAAYLDWARRVYRFRSTLPWDLDLSVLTPLGTLTLAKAWRAGDRPGEVRATTHDGAVRAHILGLEPALAGSAPEVPVQRELFAVPSEPDMSISLPYL